MVNYFNESKPPLPRILQFLPIIPFELWPQEHGRPRMAENDASIYELYMENS